jgi:hypothetical protein
MNDALYLYTQQPFFLFPITAKLEVGATRSIQLACNFVLSHNHVRAVSLHAVV